MTKPKRGVINIIFLGLTSLLTDLSSEMIAPLLPFFILSIGGTGLAVGLISGLSLSVASILKIFSGYWSDKLKKRKPLVLSGYSLSALAKFFFPFVHSWPQLLILKPTESIGKGLRTAPRDALIAEWIKKKRRGRGFGLHRAFDTTGALFGSFLALILFWIFEFDFRLIFFFAALIALTSIIPLFWVREKKKDRSQVEEEIEFNLKIALNKFPLKLKLFIFIAALFALANFSYMFFVLRTQQFFTQMVIVLPLILYIIFNFFYALLAYPLGYLSDRIGRKKVLLSGYSLFALLCLGFAFGPAWFNLQTDLSSFTYFIFLFIIYGLVFALVEGNQRAFASDLSPKNIYGTVLGTYHTAISLAALPGGLIAGLLWDMKPGGLLTFWYGFALSVIVVILFLIFFWKHKHKR